ncbi:MAG: replication/maintenance protein RepL [Clostridioides sp.]|nr:replication/maintenance protein RepL [Clostridioides sp.]
MKEGDFIFNFNKSSKMDSNENYTQSKDLFKRKDKYLNVCIKNYLRVIDDIYTKKDMIPLYLIDIMDKNNKIFKTLDELSEEINYPKTSLSSYFTKLKKMDFIKRVKNGEYMINPAIAYKGARYDRECLLEEYTKIKSKKVKS